MKGPCRLPQLRPVLRHEGCVDGVHAVPGRLQLVPETSLHVVGVTHRHAVEVGAVPHVHLLAVFEQGLAAGELHLVPADLRPAREQLAHISAAHGGPHALAALELRPVELLD